MAENNHTRLCIICGSSVAHQRWALGYKTCLPCGEAASLAVKRCVVPMNKVAYMMVTDMETLKQLNPKRTT
jgi:ribosomal protein L37AE/L43A